MPRSHPPTLLTLAARTLRDEIRIERGDRLLLAVSGGPDSMALLHALARLATGPRAKLDITLIAHGVDHGLRADAAAELDRAESLARALGVPFARTCLTVAAGSNLQARARAARYEALRNAAIAGGARFIATAHHMGDRAETLLLRLLRGAGPAGLAVLPPRAPFPAPADPSAASTPIDLVRPLLRASRAAIDAHLARHDVPSSIDPSNKDPRFLRARVRHELLPLLRALSPGIVEHLCALADQLAEERPPATDPLVSAHADRSLSRGTRVLLKEALRTRSPKTRVLLPGGLVASWDRTQPPSSASERRRRSRST